MKLFLALLLFALSSTVHAVELAEVQARTGESHPIWWWETYSGDLVATARIQYDPKKFLVIEGVETNFDRQYYIEGSIRFERVLYANAASRYVETFEHILKFPSEPRKILIRARRVFSTHMRPGDIKLEPEDAIPNDKPALCAFNQCYIFPIGHLVLDAVVPDIERKEIESVILSRKHNLISQK
ncbi:MAG: hypothetical protein HY343_03430 [Lentisphaerae bacterium]|nr:hypothetical protein [Lentisphaerota bacterium]